VSDLTTCFPLPWFVRKFFFLLLCPLLICFKILFVCKRQLAPMLCCMFVLLVPEETDVELTEFGGKGIGDDFFSLFDLKRKKRPEILRNGGSFAVLGKLA